MRFIVYGAGAIGGVVGGRLHQHGHDVVLIARGPHLDAMGADGLRIESPVETVTVRVPVAGHPSEIDIGDGDVVLLCVKSHDTAAALDALAPLAPPGIPIVCMQNGVENERVALRRFANVCGVAVACPTAHLDPGVVRQYSAPTAGVLDVGRWPQGSDATAEAVAAALDGSGFASVARPDIARWKYAKLLNNLGNAVEALCGTAARQGRLGAMVRAEGEACLAAAGIEATPVEDEAARREGHLRVGAIGGARRRGGSSWQSLARGLGSIESDYLNGEIVLLGRLHGVPTPVNALLQRLANDAARAGMPPESRTEDDVLALLG